MTSHYVGIYKEVGDLLRQVHFWLGLMGLMTTKGEEIKGVSRHGWSCVLMLVVILVRSGMWFR